MANSHISGPLVQGTDKRPAASTNVFTNKIVAGAGASIVGTLSTSSTIASSGAISGTTLTASTGFVFVGSKPIKFASGTYIGSGAATAAIVNTGLTTVYHVLMSRRGTRYDTSGGAATTNFKGLAFKPCIAGTASSFYPIVSRVGANNAATIGAGAGATFSWFALGV